MFKEVEFAATPRQIMPLNSPPGALSNTVTISNWYNTLSNEHSITSTGTHKSQTTNPDLNQNNSNVDPDLNQNNNNYDNIIGIDVKMSDTTKPELSRVLDTTWTQPTWYGHLCSRNLSLSSST